MEQVVKKYKIAKDTIKELQFELQSTITAENYEVIREALELLKPKGL